MANIDQTVEKLRAAAVQIDYSPRALCHAADYRTPIRDALTALTEAQQREQELTNAINPFFESDHATNIKLAETHRLAADKVDDLEAEVARLTVENERQAERILTLMNSPWKERT